MMRRRLAIEMATPFGWYKYVGLDGKVLGINAFGASGKAEEVLVKYGFTVENVVKQFKSLL